MITNNNSDYIIIDRDNWDKLLNQALIGDGELNNDNATIKAIRAARKLNPAYEKELAADEEKRRIKEANDAKRAADFIKAYKDKEIWYIEEPGQGPENGWQNCLLKLCTVVGPSPEWRDRKDLVECEFKDKYDVVDGQYSIHISKLASKEQIPEVILHRDWYWASRNCYTVEDRIRSV